MKSLEFREVSLEKIDKSRVLYFLDCSAKSTQID